jgi:toluene monooxygenase system ferredoxin subunit
MPFVSVCKEGDLREGEMSLLRVQRKSVLLVWPKAGQIRAYRGRCPHQDVPLENASFDGTTIVCSLHQWCFDGRTGEGMAAHACTLKAYPLRFEEGEVQVELG